MDSGKLKLLGALLKKGGYRSGTTYVSDAKRTHLELDYPWSEQLTLVHMGCSLCTYEGAWPS